MIIITGASKGLGLAISERLIQQGHDVLGLARNTEELHFRAIQCDVSNASDVSNVAKTLKLEGAKVNALINAAGIAAMNLAVMTPAKQTDAIIKTNLLGTIYCCQQFSPLMMRQKAGSIINFSSIAVALGLKGESIYAASKAGVEGFTRSFAREMSEFNINVNCISPGPINTNLLKGISNSQIQAIVSQQIIRKQFSPDDVCDLVECLLHKNSHSLSGQVFHVGGA